MKVIDVKKNTGSVENEEDCIVTYIQIRGESYKVESNINRKRSGLGGRETKPVKKK